jgi:hypothetical protein
VNRILIISDDDIGTQETKAGKTVLDTLKLEGDTQLAALRKGHACSYVKAELDAIPCIILVRDTHFKVLKGKNAGSIYEAIVLPQIILNEQGM